MTEENTTINAPVNDTVSIQANPETKPAAETSTLAPESQNQIITIDDFAKVQMKTGKILSAEKVEGSPKLLKLSVDFGEATPRQVLSGIAKSFQPEDMIGKTFAFVTNLQPRQIMGQESQAMILAASGATDESGNVGLALFSPNREIAPGSELG